VDCHELSGLEKAKGLLAEQGFFLARNLFDTERLLEIRRYISNLISQLHVSKIGHPTDVTDGDGFDAGFRLLCERDRAFGGIIYRACRRLAPVHALSADDTLLALSKKLIGTEYIACSNLKAIRIDHPNEDQYLFDIHQDYPYIMDSLNALVFWIPLRSVKPGGGCLKVYPGTHKLGLQKVKVVDENNTKKNGAHTIEICRKDHLKDLESIELPVAFGECLVFSTLLLHQSTPNHTDQYRWTLQVRHGDFNYPDAVKREWPGGMIEGESVVDKHPEHVEVTA